MKKKFLAWTAAILIVAAVSVCFLVPSDPNPDFGMVRDVYTFPLPEMPITDCEGDTDILNVTAMTYGNYPSMEMREIFEPQRDIALTDGMYLDGKCVTKGTLEGIGILERYEDGEWVFRDDILDYNDKFLFLIFGAPPYPTLSKDRGRDWFEINFPTEEPGTYRLTYFFRESISSENGHYTTGEELYSISHTFVVPEPTQKPFDIVGTSGFFWGYEEENYYRCTFSLAIRPNNGGTLFHDRARNRLEVLENGRWTEAPIPEGFDFAVEGREETDKWRYDDLTDFTHERNVLQTESLHLNITDRDAEYRLKLEFVENGDGSGERYALTLHLKFTY